MKEHTRQHTGPEECSMVWDVWGGTCNERFRCRPKLKIVGVGSFSRVAEDTHGFCNNIRTKNTPVDYMDYTHADASS